MRWVADYWTGRLAILWHQIQFERLVSHYRQLDCWGIYATAGGLRGGALIGAGHFDPHFDGKTSIGTAFGLSNLCVSIPPCLRHMNERAMPRCE